MRIHSIRLQNFKRFTDLRLTDIRAATRLVLLIGANGSGKSSVFDAMEYASRPRRGISTPGEMSPAQRRAYYSKGDLDESIEIDFGDVRGAVGNAVFSAEASEKSPAEATALLSDRLRRLYGRSTLRVAARIGATSTRSGQSLLELIDRDQDAPPTFIDSDSRLMADAMKFAVDFNEALRRPVFEGRQVDILALRDELIEPINKALERVFGSLGPYPQMVNFREPESTVEPIKYFFRKGEHTFAYDVLSFGEKQVFALLLNLFVRRTKLSDAVIYIDEMDLHLNTALQYALLEEIVEEWIPANSQLWTASHSLGFIRYAMDHDHAAIFDFDALDFDQPQTLTPAPKETSEVLQVAVPAEFLPSLFVGKRLIYCEGHDAAKYNSVGLENTIFVGGGNKFQVHARARDGAMPGLVDRDYLTDAEIQQWAARLPQLRILRMYSIENYLYHPDNLAEVHGPGFDRAAYVAAITAAKNTEILDLALGIAKARDGYPFARDLNESQRAAYHAGSQGVLDALKSDDFDRFYPVFPMKDRATRLPQRQNSTPIRLARTQWFAAKLTDLLAGVPLLAPAPPDRKA
jgi:energy-coupling factor transporter ATP-binding protein EcfA2